MIYGPWVIKEMHKVHTCEDMRPVNALFYLEVIGLSLEMTFVDMVLLVWPSYFYLKM